MLERVYSKAQPEMKSKSGKPDMNNKGQIVEYVYYKVFQKYKK